MITVPREPIAAINLCRLVAGHFFVNKLELSAAAKLGLLLASRQAVFLAHLCDKVLRLFRNGDLIVDYRFNLFWGVGFPSVAKKLIAFFIHVRIFHQLGKRFAQDFYQMVRRPFWSNNVLIELGCTGPAVISLPGKTSGVFCPQKFGECGDLWKIFTPAIFLRADDLHDALALEILDELGILRGP